MASIRRFLLGPEAFDPERPARRPAARIGAGSWHGLPEAFNPNEGPALAAGEVRTSLISSKTLPPLGTPWMSLP
jgi:hypothetical protein